jgi:hypothetical protein
MCYRTAKLNLKKIIFENFCSLWWIILRSPSVIALLIILICCYGEVNDICSNFPQKLKELVLLDLSGEVLQENFINYILFLAKRRYNI